MNKNFRQQFLPYLFCYAAWLGFIVVGYWLFTQLRATLFDLVWLSSQNVWLARSVNQWSAVILGLAWLVAIMFLENYLRVGVTKSQLWARIKRVLWVSLAIAGMTIGVQLILIPLLA